jgi:hypothetical protein
VVSNCEECLRALQTLGISPPTSDEEIRSSFRDYARVWHPDRFVHDEKLRLRAEQELKRINVANDHLKSHVLEEEEPDDEAPSGYHEEESHSWETDNRPVRSNSQGPLAWRGIKVSLRAIWRLFKVSAMLAVGAVFVIGIIAQLATYWSNEAKREKGDFHAEIKSWKTDFYLSNLLGIPLPAVRGLIFLSSTLLLILVFIGEAIWESILSHEVVAISLLAAVSLCCVAWASFLEYQSEFLPAASSKAPGTTSWVMGLIVLLCTIAGLHYFVLLLHAVAPATVTSEQPQQQPTPAIPPAVVKPKELWRPAGAVKDLLVWDFRDALHNDQVTDPDTLQRLRGAIEPSIAGHLDEFVFYGPLSGNFLGEVPNSHQQLYTAVLSWIAAGRSHADGDLVLAVVLGSDGTQVFELQGGGVGIGALRLAGARQDLILSAPEWSGQGETMRGLGIFALSNDQARKVAGISTVYDDNCASGSSQHVVVADRIFTDVDATGDFSFSHKEHWSSPCSQGGSFTLVSKGTESAEDVLVRLDTPDGVPSKEPVTVSSPAEDSGVLDALNEWRQALLSNDPDRQLGCYAPHLERYFLKSDVDRSFVFSDLMAQREQGSSVVNLSIDQVKTAIESDVITDVDFVENVSFVRHGRPRSLTVHTFLKLTKAEGTWKIFYVRQLNT